MIELSKAEGFHTGALLSHRQRQQKRMYEGMNQSSAVNEASAERPGGGQTNPTLASQPPKSDNSLVSVNSRGNFQNQGPGASLSSNATRVDVNMLTNSSLMIPKPEDGAQPNSRTYVPLRDRKQHASLSPFRSRGPKTDAE